MTHVSWSTNEFPHIAKRSPRTSRGVTAGRTTVLRPASQSSSSGVLNFGDSPESTTLSVAPEQALHLRRGSVLVIWEDAVTLSCPHHPWETKWCTRNPQLGTLGCSTLHDVELATTTVNVRVLSREPPLTAVRCQLATSISHDADDPSKVNRDPWSALEVNLVDEQSHSSSGDHSTKDVMRAMNRRGGLSDR